MKRLLFIWLVLLLFMGCPPPFSSAHSGGDIQISARAAGPYRFTVWTYPPQVRAGQPLHVTVSLVTGAEETAVLDATVRVEATSLATNQTISALATTEQSTNKLLYEAVLPLPDEAAGSYLIVITGEAPPGEGEVSFELEVRTTTTPGFFTIGFVALGLIASILFYKVWQKQAANQIVD